jgi:hypothetical protein
VPAKFNAAESLPPELRRRADDANWLVDTICRKTDQGKADYEGDVRLHSGILRRFMRDGPAVVRGLVNAGDLEQSSSYRVGHWPKGYRLTEKHRSGRREWVQARNASFIRRYQRESTRLHEEEAKKLWLPIDYRLFAMQRNLTIGEGTDAILETIEPDDRPNQARLLEHIRRGASAYSIGATGRRFNAITQMAKVLRPCLRLAGERIVGLDVRATQPALLGTLIELGVKGKTCNIILSALVSRLREIEAPVPRCRRWTGLPGLEAAVSAPRPGPDFEVYLEAVDNDLYNDLVRRCMEREIDLGADPAARRSRAKHLMMQDILGRRGWYHSSFQGVFEEAFPTVLRFARHIQKAGHGDRWHGELIRVLQRLESWLVVEQVAPVLVDRGVLVVTLHDEFYIRERDTPIARSVFADVCGRLGLEHLHLKEK